MNLVFSSKNFSYHPPTKTFVSDMSTLQCYKPDVITIVSSKTGVEVGFLFHGELRDIEDYDGDLKGLEYRSLNGEYKIHLYND